MKAKPLSSSYKRRLEEAVDDLKHYLADMEITGEIEGDAKAVRRYMDNPKAASAYRRDVPLAEVDKLWLERITDYLKSPPFPEEGPPHRAARADQGQHRQDAAAALAAGLRLD
jgi:hypothetical protein